MPSTVVNSGRHTTASGNFVTNRTRQRSSASNIAGLTPNVTTRRRAQSTLIGKNDANGSATIPDDLRRRLIDCSVALVDVFAQGTPFKLSSNRAKENNKITQIQSIPQEGKASAEQQSNSSPSERNSNVTRRTRPRRTKSVGQTQQRLADRQRHTINSVSEDHLSIVHLDESSNIGTKSIAETVDLSHKQTVSGNDVIDTSATNVAAVPEPRRITRRMSSKSTDCNQNTINARATPKRKTNDGIPSREVIGVAPPKQALSAQQSVLEHSVEAAGQNDTVRTTVTGCTQQSLDTLNSDAFNTLIVSIKRIAPALPVDELKRIKYDDSTRDSHFSQRASSSKASWRQKNSIKQERPSLAGPSSTMAKPKLVITSPIIEVPESPPPVVLERNTVVNSSYLTVPNTSTAKWDLFKKPHPAKNAPMPLLQIEEENEENDDVYTFLSSSQNSDIPAASKPKPKQQKKPKQKKVPTASAAAKTVNSKSNGSMAKPKGKQPQKRANHFGCDKQTLRKVIKRLGGGPVQQPGTLNYKINLDIPKTPPVARSPVNVPPPKEDAEQLPNDGHLASPETTRTLHPSLDRLKKSSLSFPITSTPTNRVVNTANQLSVPSAAEKPASPWRLQDELIVPRTSYVHRTKELLPSYESFAIATEQQPVGAAGFVTERRKSPSDGTSIDPVPALPTPEHGVGIISDRELREIEQMYVELKATSEMSEKLIRAMRLSKQKAATPQQDQTMRQACQKLKKWYDRSMNAFTRSMRILGNIQRATGGGLNAANDRSRAACPSPLSHEQQRTVNEFNSSTDRFRSMLAQLHSTINDSDVENHPPPPPTIDAESAAPSKGPSLSATKKVQILQDIIILPARSDAAKRNPLMPLNVVPLPQRDSPVMSPLAKPPTNPGPRDASSGPNNTRRELQYDKENELSTNIVDKDHQPADTGTTTQPPGGAPSVLEINDDTAMHGDGSGHSGHKHLPATTDHNSRDYFGFDDNSGNSDGVVESSLAQVTLPMPLNISHETLERRLQTVKQLLPKRPIFRARPKQQNPRSSGPTRFPLVPKLCVIGSPQKRPHTLRDFVASTPRAVTGGGSSKEPPNEAPDVSAIEPIAAEQQPQSEKQTERNNESDVVALFDTPDRPAWLNNSAHQRTYSRIPKRRKKKNIYLANLGLDDDSEDEENDEPEELSSDSESDRKKKAKQKARRKKQIPVEETKDFKQFVDSFNSMCEQVERYEMIVE